MRLSDVEAVLREIVAGLELERPEHAAARLVETFATIEKLAGAARRWPPGGWPSPTSGGARVSAPPPTGWPDAAVLGGRGDDHAGDRSGLAELPGVDTALRAGELSAVQANEIASAAAADPGAADG